MTRLRDALAELAEQAPAGRPGVSLAHAAIARHRRRRRGRVTLAAVAAAAAVLADGGVSALRPTAAHPASPARQAEVIDLPDGPVGVISHSYRVPCAYDHAAQKADCDVAELRVVTVSGKTYKVAQALLHGSNERPTPVAISRDGRLFAYYRADAGTFVVRDLVKGGERAAPVRIEPSRIGVGAMLALSDDGRYLVFDPREGSKQDATMIDVIGGRTTPIPGVYEVISIRGDVAELIRYRKTDLWLRPFAGGGKPVRFKGPHIMFSELAPDGRTVAATRFPEHTKNLLTILDVKTGRSLRKVPIRGLPRGSRLTAVTTWASPSEVLIVAGGKQDHAAYAVDVRSGQARHVRDFRQQLWVGLPGVTSTG
ncbi:hypothetical protein MF672_019995 [Actinomadura sp. ATCC 31491]|uniref:WD40 repeat domain-containing protein n=1 Tax=Actinomadura luzonensis TaxID=2805427 RepID=A0ABT0FUQ6_9ACTN|nr:hypothetical protein [Actinomadura luzonensis]MCK2216062.1 hypothetical protein [Actinomadura luzonensis]